MKAGKAAEGAPSRRVAMLLDLFRKQKHHQGWNNRARKEVGREQSKHDRFSKRNKKVASHSGQEEHRHKNNANAESGNLRGQRDLLGSIENGWLQRFARSHVPMNVLYRDSRIIHQNADS